MKEKLVREFIEKLDYSYSYKTVNERQNIINELCKIAGIEQLTIPEVVVPKGTLVCDCGSNDIKSTEYGFFKCNDCKNEWDLAN